MTKLMRSPFSAALIGGLVVAAAFLIAGVGDSTTTRTVVEQAPLAASRPASQSVGLTPRQIYEKTAPGVVFITAQVVQDQQSSPFGLPQQQQGQATGSGFVIDNEGHIITNAHVVDGASKVTVKLEDKITRQAKVVGKDPSTDIALLKIDPSGLKLDPLPLGNDGPVQVGDPVLAIGNPFGLDRTLTTGVISAKQRKIDAPNGFSIDHVLQTDAAINPGNSGGPLLDAAGRVIGINSQIATGGSGGGFVGIGFAVPIDTAKKVLPDLERSGRVQRAYLGIEGVTIDSSFARIGLKATSGVLIQQVTPGGPAQKAGLRGGNVQSTVGGQQIRLGGDVIVKVDGRQMRTIDDVVSTIARKHPGQKVQVEVLRDGKPRTVTVTLTDRPAELPNG
ncbi:MAG: trypsin-like peptidase domain-containing protein [Solirubrobacteraceae bacterium]